MVRVNDLAEKTTAVAAWDELVLIDSEDSDKTKRIAATEFKWDTWDTGATWPQGDPWLDWGAYYDCIVADDWSWDYTLVEDAIDDGNFRIFVKSGTYNEVRQWRLSEWDLSNNYPKYVIQWCGNSTIINMTFDDNEKIDLSGDSDNQMFEIRDMQFNVTLWNEDWGDNYFISASSYKGILENLNINVTIDNTYTQDCVIINGWKDTVIRNCLIEESNEWRSTWNVTTLEWGSYYNCEINLWRMKLSPDYVYACEIYGSCVSTAPVTKVVSSDYYLEIYADANINFNDVTNSDINCRIKSNTGTTQEIDMNNISNSYISIEDSTSWALDGTTTIDKFENLTNCRINIEAPADISWGQRINSSSIDLYSTYTTTHRTNSTYTSFVDCSFDDGNTSSTFLVENLWFRFVWGFLKVKWWMTISTNYAVLTWINYFDCPITVTSDYNSIYWNTNCDSVTFNSWADSNVCIWNTSIDVTDNWASNQVANNT